MSDIMQPSTKTMTADTTIKTMTKLMPGSIQVLPAPGIPIDPKTWHCRHCGLTPLDPCTLWISGTLIFDGRYNPETKIQVHPQTQVRTTLEYWMRESETLEPMYICRDGKNWVIVKSLDVRREDTVILAQSVGIGTPADVSWPQGMVISREKPIVSLSIWDRMWSLFSSPPVPKSTAPCVHCGLLNTDVRHPVWVSLESPYTEYSGQFSPCPGFTWMRDLQDQPQNDPENDRILASLKLECNKRTWTWTLKCEFGILATSQRDSKHPADAVWLDPGIVVSRKPFWFS